jgi:ABC-type uncharacterized transport system substrate-binding protein
VSTPELKEVETAAHSSGLQLQSVSVTKPSDFTEAFNSIRADRAQALIVLSDAMFFGNQNRLPITQWQAGCQ